MNGTSNENDIIEISEINESEVVEPAAVCPGCCGKTKVRSAEELAGLMNRLRRIEGQVRGVEGMLERDAYCIDILMQVSAITSALNGFSKELLSEHIKTCVADGIRHGDDVVIDELTETLRRLMK